jgi:hypothetical protein
MPVVRRTVSAACDSFAACSESPLRLLSRPPLLLSLADLLPSRSGHFPAAFPRSSDFRRKACSRPARSLAKRRRHRTLAARRGERWKFPTDGSYLRLKFFDSSRGTNASEFLELRCWWHIGGDHIHNWIASANAVVRRRANAQAARGSPSTCADRVLERIRNQAGRPGDIILFE